MFRKNTTKVTWKVILINAKKTKQNVYFKIDYHKIRTEIHSQEM